MKKLLAVFIPCLAFAQGPLDPAEIYIPLGDQWTTYSGEYTGKRFSSLAKINQSNVKNLSLAWVSRFSSGCGPTGSGEGGGGRGGRGGGGVATPIIVGGLGKGDLNNCGGARLGGGILM